MALLTIWEAIAWFSNWKSRLELTYLVQSMRLMSALLQVIQKASYGNFTHTKQ